MENKPKLRLDSKENIEPNSEKGNEVFRYKMLVQDPYNEFSGIERLATFTTLKDEDFFDKISNYNIKKFEEYHEEKGNKYDDALVDELYPGYVARFNRLVEKIKNKDISRSEIISELQELYSETAKALPEEEIAA